MRRGRGIGASRVVMWAGILAAGVVLIGLLARGWGSDAWNAAAGVLLLACVAACGVAVMTGRQSERAIRAELTRWMATRSNAAAPGADRLRGLTEEPRLAGDETHPATPAFHSEALTTHPQRPPDW